MSKYVYLVQFEVGGLDHTGYCSSENAESKTRTENHVTIDKECVMMRVSLLDFLEASDFDFEDSGCTSGGSGYCFGFGRVFTGTKILSVTEVDDDIIICEPEK